MNGPSSGRRSNQRHRTRKDLLQAASRLMQRGVKPTLDEVAQEALVSRATAYRYFSSIDDLLVEATLDVAVPEPDELFDGAPADDPVARLELVDDALRDSILANEGAARLMLARALERSLRSDGAAAPPRRQNRRTPLIEAALEPVRHQFTPAALKSLVRALALVIGTEGVVVCKDVLQLEDREAGKVRRWAIRALVEAAKKPH